MPNNCVVSFALKLFALIFRTVLRQKMQHNFFLAFLFFSIFVLQLVSRGIAEGIKSQTAS